MLTQQAPLWTPNPENFSSTRSGQFIAYINERFGLEVSDYSSLYDWSVACRESFWQAVWDFTEVIGRRGKRTLLQGDNIEESIWFPDASLNFAENLLREKGDDVAIYFRAEDKVAYNLTWDELHRQVASLAAWLKFSKQFEVCKQYSTGKGKLQVGVGRGLPASAGARQLAG